MIRSFKRESTIQSNVRENQDRLHHTYKPGDKILTPLKANDEVITKMVKHTRKALYRGECLPRSHCETQARFLQQKHPHPPYQTTS